MEQQIQMVKIDTILEFLVIFGRLNSIILLSSKRANSRVKL